jgi:hypothetical protein
LRKLFIALIIWAALIAWAAADAFAGPSLDAAAAQLYSRLTTEREWRTEDAGGNPAKCRFLGTDDESYSGIVFVVYVGYEDSSEVVRTSMLWWTIAGDVLDIQGNYFVLSHMGQLYRVPPPQGEETVRQTVRPGSW